MDIPKAQALHAATSLTRATGENWFARLSPSRQAMPDDLTRLGRICFRDAVAARHLRAWLGLTRHGDRPSGLDGPEAAAVAARMSTDPDFARIAKLIFKDGDRRRAPYAGLPTFLDAPIQDGDPSGLQVAIYGMPMDLAVTNRNGRPSAVVSHRSSTASPGISRPR